MNGRFGAPAVEDDQMVLRRVECGGHRLLHVRRVRCGSAHAADQL